MNVILSFTYKRVGRQTFSNLLWRLEGVVVRYFTVRVL